MRKDWLEVEIEEILSKINGKLITQGWSPQCLKNPSPSNDIWGVLKTTAIQKGEFREYENKELPIEKTVREHLEVKKGDVLMTCAGPRNRCGITCVVKTVRPKLLLSGKMYRFRPDETIIITSFLSHFLQSEEAWRAIDKMKSGGSESGLNLTHSRFKKLPLRIAPLPEQRAIVSKIEQLFSSLDHGIAQLKTVQAQLRVYRQAVLKKAFEGELTKEWRARQTDLPTAAEIADLIKEERKADFARRMEEWEKDIEEWKAGGEVDKKPRKPSKFKDFNNLSQGFDKNRTNIPNTWLWLKMSDLAKEMCLGKMLDKKKNKGEYKPYLGNINVRWGAFRLGDLKEMRFEKFEKERYKLEYGDLVICEGGEPGRCAIWKSNDEMMIQKALHRVRFFKKITNSDFVYYYLTLIGQTGHIAKHFTGTTIKHLTGRGLSEISFPLPSLPEQAQIIQEIESRLSVCDKIAETVEISLKKSESLRQSILKRAFAGELLTAAELERCRAEEDWESAADLLKRIRAEKGKLKK